MPADAKLALLSTETAEKPEARRSMPPTSPEQPAKTSVATERAPGPSRRRWLSPALFALLPLALIVGGYWYVTGGQVMSTDDAYVQAETVGISTDVSGIVRNIDVANNQRVDAGQVLYDLDPRQFQIALENAKANLAQTALTIDSMKQDYALMLSDAAAQQAQVGLDQATYARSTSLLPSGAATKASYDQARFTLELTRTSSNRCASRPRCGSQNSTATLTFR
jgi:membrane fusion protein (multidrug efflux system)